MKAVTSASGRRRRARDERAPSSHAASVGHGDIEELPLISSSQEEVCAVVVTRTPRLTCLSNCPYWTAMQTNPLAGLSIQQLKRAVAIREKVEGLERELDGIISGKPVGKGSARRRKGLRRGGSRGRISKAAKGRAGVQRRIASPRGGLKGRIIGALRAAGDKGATVKDLARKLGKSYGNISVWFHTTGKGVKEIKKVPPGKFAWET